MKHRVVSTGKGIFPSGLRGTMTDGDLFWQLLYIGRVVWDLPEQHAGGILVRAEEVRVLTVFENLILEVLEANDATGQSITD